MAETDKEAVEKIQKENEKEFAPKNIDAEKMGWKMYNTQCEENKILNMKLKQALLQKRELEIQLEREQKSVADRIRDLEKRVDNLSRNVAQQSSLTSMLRPLK